MNNKLFTLLLCLLCVAGGAKATADLSATWDFKNSTVVAEIIALKGSNEAGTIKAVEDNGILLTVEANGKNIRDNGNSIQTGDGVVFKVPVVSTNDIVTVEGYSSPYFAYSLAGVDATDATTSYTANSSDVAKGYVEIVNKGQYIIAIKLTAFRDIRVNFTDDATYSWSTNFANTSTGYLSVSESGDVSLSMSSVASPAATIRGKWHGTTYGLQSMSASVAVPGYVKITYGKNDYGSEVTITNSAGTTVGTINNQDKTGKWSLSNSSFVETTYYNSSEPTTLNFSSCAYVGYFAVEKMSEEEIAALNTTYTLTYYDTDGETVLGTQNIAANAAITSFSYVGSEPTVASGYTFRGWFALSGKKYKTTDVVTSDLSLYAVATETEVSSDDKTYTFDLRNQYFYDEDHEAFNASAGTFHDNQHGWSFGNGNTIDLLVGAKAIISVSICQYSKDGATIQVKKGDTVLATLDGKTATDGSTVSYNYQGEAGTLTLQVVSTGTVYIHSIEIVNYNSAAFTKTGQWYVVEAGSADGFLKALALANAANGSTGAERSYIYLPNGTYDLGTTALTQLSGHNISIMGESRDGVIIKNTPVKEGINITATLVNTGTNNFLQNLTLQCRAPYGTGDDTSSAERGVCLWDKGDRLICRNVYLKGLQDTYFSNYSTTGHQAYFEDSKIEGTVDFICGNGNVLFNRCELYVTDRSQNNAANVIVAPNTAAGDKGYLFTGCTINATSFQTGKYSLGRPWNNSPAATFIGTVMTANGSDAGWTKMTDGTALRFHEYATTSSTGTEVTTHNVTACAAATADELYITAGTAHDSYAYGAFLTGGWDPAAVAAELSAPDNTLGLAAPAAIEATISAAGYATFVPAAKVSVPAGVTAYIATASDATTVTLSPVSVIPAHEPVILKGSAGTYTFSRTAAVANDVESNILKWSPAVLVSCDKAEYVLAQEAGVVGFHPVTSGSLIQPGKAYLTVGAGAREFLTFVEESTGVGATLNDNGEMTNDKPVYNLAGQRVSKPSKGLYIVGGKKVALR